MLLSAAFCVDFLTDTWKSGTVYKTFVNIWHYHISFTVKRPQSALKWTISHSGPQISPVTEYLGWSCQSFMSINIMYQNLKFNCFCSTAQPDSSVSQNQNSADTDKEDPYLHSLCWWCCVYQLSSMKKVTRTGYCGISLACWSLQFAQQPARLQLFPKLLWVILIWIYVWGLWILNTDRWKICRNFWI